MHIRFSKTTSNEIDPQLLQPEVWLDSSSPWLIDRMSPLRYFDFFRVEKQYFVFVGSIGVFSDTLYAFDLQEMCFFRRSEIKDDIRVDKKAKNLDIAQIDFFQILKGLETLSVSGYRAPPQSFFGQKKMIIFTEKTIQYAHLLQLISSRFVEDLACVRESFLEDLFLSDVKLIDLKRFIRAFNGSRQSFLRLSSVLLGHLGESELRTIMNKFFFSVFQGLLQISSDENSLKCISYPSEPVHRELEKYSNALARALEAVNSPSDKTEVRARNLSHQQKNLNIIRCASTKVSKGKVDSFHISLFANKVAIDSKILAVPVSIKLSSGPNKSSIKEQNLETPIKYSDSPQNKTDLFSSSTKATDSLKLILKNEKGQPIPAAVFVLHLEDGSTINDCLDKEGVRTIRYLKPGYFKVQYTDIKDIAMKNSAVMMNEALETNSFNEVIKVLCLPIENLSKLKQFLTLYFGKSLLDDTQRLAKTSQEKLILDHLLSRAGISTGSSSQPCAYQECSWENRDISALSSASLSWDEERFTKKHPESQRSGGDELV